MPPQKKRSEPRTLTRELVEAYFGLFESAIGDTACKVLHQRGAGQHWYNVLSVEHVTVDELAAALNMASERGAPYQGISIAWVMGMVRDYRNRQREEAERQQRPAARDKARVPAEDLPFMRECKAALKAVADSEVNSPERLAASKHLHEFLFGPNAKYRPRQGEEQSKRSIARLETKLAEQAAAQARDEAFVTQAGGDASKLEDLSARKAVQAEPMKVTFDDDTVPF